MKPRDPLRHRQTVATTTAPREEAEVPKGPLGCVVANGRAQDELPKEVMGGFRMESWHQTRMGASTEIVEYRNPLVIRTYRTVEHGGLHP